MNKILIFAGCQEATLLIQKISDNFLNLGEFHIIYEEDEIKNGFNEKENLYFYKINFYAYELYKNILHRDLNKIIIFVKNKKEAEFILKNSLDKKVPILFVKFWLDFDIPQQNNIEIIDIPELLTNKVIDFLPGVPLFARDIGLGIGEILEVEVPPHSPFVYSHPNKLQNDEARVAAIYRNNELRLINENTMILPNDKLLLIGQPEALKDLFNKIKKNIGAFPQPYGQNIYLLLDMKNMEQKEISALLKSALYLHRKLKNKKLIIKIINPSINNQIYKLYKFENIEISSDYYETSYSECLKKDAKIFNIGLIVTNNDFFFKYSHLYYDLKLPIFKKGEESIKKCKGIKVLIQENEIKPIASVIFDLSFQLNKPLTFIDGDPENKHTELIEYLTNFAKLFNFKDVHIEKTKDNPIFELNKEDNQCVITPFTKKPVPKIWQIINPKMEYSYLFLNKFNQFLIPVK
ncbi:putative TrkA-C [Nautilia profundicola AmH]|uniref:TrkA-C n=1 Tax=Nautilia profundicola (strain ATCC BAA-1463 / DSM 18972 / AmH) TaxID=598659 RepID=B9L8E0_NAUPA|nr:TrkA C-terminal domain-containing protein [Nautilia profundicola]ACM93187.1 putative TrkA-C [Nautilia profundicola AmH]